MKDVTTTSFGLVIAYILPGLVGLYSLTFWSSNVKSIAQTVYSAKSDLGLSIIVLAAAVVVGLQVNALRFLCYERLLCRTKRLEANLFTKLVEQDKLSAFTTVLEENFRYHQFFGSMTLILPVLEAGLLKYINRRVDIWFISLTTLFTLSVAFLMFMRHEINGGTAGLKEYVWCKNALRSLAQKVGRKRAQVAVLSGTVFSVVIYAGWVYLYQGISNRLSVFTFVLSFVVLEVVTGAAAIVALRRYVERVTNLLT